MHAGQVLERWRRGDASRGLEDVGQRVEAEEGAPRWRAAFRRRGAGAPDSATPAVRTRLRCRARVR
jgi:hypothetical protein